MKYKKQNKKSVKMTKIVQLRYLSTDLSKDTFYENFFMLPQLLPNIFFSKKICGQMDLGVYYPQKKR